MVTLLGWGAAAGRQIRRLAQAEVERIYSLPAEHFRERQRIKAEGGTGIPVGTAVPGAGEI